jgi:hypothetical protein
MTEELDPFDWALAEGLGMTVERMRAEMSNPEWHSWRAFYVYRAAQRELANKEATRGR